MVSKFFCRMMTRTECRSRQLNLVSYLLCSALTFRSHAQSIYFVIFSGGASSLFTLFRKKRWKRWLNSGFLKTNEGRKRTKHARSFAQVSIYTILNTTYCVNHNQLHGHSIRSEPRWTCSPTWARSSLCRWRWAGSWLICRVADPDPDLECH